MSSTTTNPKCSHCRCYWIPQETDVRSSGLPYKTCGDCRLKQKWKRQEKKEKTQFKSVLGAYLLPLPKKSKKVSQPVPEKPKTPEMTLDQFIRKVLIRSELCRCRAEEMEARKVVNQTFGMTEEKWQKEFEHYQQTKEWITFLMDECNETTYYKDNLRVSDFKRY